MIMADIYKAWGHVSNSTKKYCTLFIIWWLLMFVDCMVMRVFAFRMSVKEFIYVLVQPFCYATLFISIRLLLGNRFGKWFNVILFSYLTILEGVESLIVLRFGAYMTGDLIMICLNSSWTEMVAFINDMSLVNVVGGVVVFTAIFSTGIKVMMQSI